MYKDSCVPHGVEYRVENPCHTTASYVSPVLPTDKASARMSYRLLFLLWDSLFRRQALTTEQQPWPVHSRNVQAGYRHRFLHALSQTSPAEHHRHQEPPKAPSVLETFPPSLHSSARYGINYTAFPRCSSRNWILDCCCQDYRSRRVSRNTAPQAIFGHICRTRPSKVKSSASSTKHAETEMRRKSPTINPSRPAC